MLVSLRDVPGLPAVFILNFSSVQLGEIWKMAHEGPEGDVEVTLTLPCGCVIATAYGSSEEAVFRTFERQFRRTLKSQSTDEVLQEACRCNDEPNDEILNLLTEEFEDGTTRVALHCPCGGLLYAAREESEDEALAKVSAEAIRLQVRQGSDVIDCIPCRLKKEEGLVSSARRHSGRTSSGRVMPKTGTYNSAG